MKKLQSLSGIAKCLVVGDILGTKLAMGAWENFEGDDFYYLKYGEQEIAAHYQGPLLEALGVTYLGTKDAYYFAQIATERQLHPLQMAKEIMDLVRLEEKRMEAEEEENRNMAEAASRERGRRGKELAAKLKTLLAPEEFELLEPVLKFRGWLEKNSS